MKKAPRVIVRGFFVYYEIYSTSVEVIILVPSLLV